MCRRRRPDSRAVTLSALLGPTLLPCVPGIAVMKGDTARAPTLLSCRERTARHARIPRAQGECQLNRLQGLAPACKARDLVSTPAHLVVLLRIRPPKIPKAALATASASSSTSRAVDSKLPTSLWYKNLVRMGGRL